jgi:hypothetical protein
VAQAVERRDVLDHLSSALDRFEAGALDGASEYPPADVAVIVQAAPLLTGCLLALLLERNLMPRRVRSVPLAPLGMMGLVLTWAISVHLTRGHQFAVQISRAACSPRS